MTKNALITGAARRVGFKIATALQQEGWNVIIHHNSTPVKDFTSLKADLNNFKETSKLIAKANSMLGEISLLINNASIFERVDFATTDEKLFDANFNVHVKAPFFLAQEFAKQCTTGQIINIVDSFSLKNKSQFFAYSLSKKSLRNLSKMLAAELGPQIRVNAIFPGPIKEFSNELDQNFLKRKVENLSMKKLASVNEVTAAIINLTKNNLTGQEIFIDGRRTTDMIIKIKNLHAQTIIGVYDWEKEVERDLIVNIELELDGKKAAITDDVNDTVNYDALSQMIIQEITDSRFNLLEKLASHLLNKIMEHQLIHRAKIEIDKGGVVQHVDNVSVTDERTRN